MTFKKILEWIKALFEKPNKPIIAVKIKSPPQQIKVYPALNRKPRKWYNDFKDSQRWYR